MRQDKRKVLISYKPAIIGVNKEDGNAFAPYVESGPDQTLSETWFLQLFLCPSFKTAK